MRTKLDQLGALHFLGGINDHLGKYKPFLKLRLHVVLGDSSPPLSLLADMLS